MQARSPYASREAGLSLIEILVGISILAIVAFAVTLTMAPTRTPLQAASDALSARLQVARDEAIISGTPIGLAIDDFGTGYAFYRYLDQAWWPLSDHPALRARVLPETVRLVAREAMYTASDSDAAAAIPVIWFDPAGLTEPFRLRLETAEASVDLDWQASAGQTAGGLTRSAGL